MNRGFGIGPVPGQQAPEEQEGLSMDHVVLRVLNGPGQGRTFPLNALRLVVGRNAPPANVVEIDLSACELGTPAMVSRRHAELQRVNGELLIRDLGSTNGTWVNGERLMAHSGDTCQPSVPKMLKAGDRLLFGNLEVEVVVAM